MNNFMQARKENPGLSYLLPGVVAAIAFTAVIGLTAANLSGFQIVGKTGIAFCVFTQQET